MTYCKAIRKIYAPLSWVGSHREEVLAIAEQAGYRIANFNNHIWVLDPEARWIETPLMLEDLRCDEGR